MTDTDEDGPGPQRSSFSIVEVLVVGGAVMLVAGVLLLPLLRSKPRHVAEGQRCANNLKGVAIGMILYANDYRFYPHMRGLTADHDAVDVSKVYRTLIHFRYADTAELFICPGSDDLPILQGPEGTPRWLAKQWSWQGRPNSTTGAPILQSGDPPVFGNAELSYTARRKVLGAARARSTDSIAADKAERSPTFKADGIGGGNHQGFSHVVFADGHVESTDKAKGKGLRAALIKALLVGSSDGEELDPKTGKPIKPAPIPVEPTVR